MQKQAGDVNGDGKTNSGDAILILRKSAGLLAQFPRADKGVSDLTDLVKLGPVELAIYDLTGAVVRRLVSGWQGAGGYAVRQDGRDEGGRVVASGLYLGCLESGQVRQVPKRVLLK